MIGISQPGPFVDQIESAGIRHISLEHATRSMSLLSDAKAMIEFRQVIRQLSPDIVHTHNPKPGIYGRVLSAISDVPVVINTVHGIYATETDSLGRRAAVYALERMAACFSDVELIQNEEDLALLRNLRVPQQRLRYLGNGIDLTRFRLESIDPGMIQRFRSQLGATDESVIVLAAGRLVWEKGYRELFAAAARLHSSTPAALFVIAGPSEPSKADGIPQTDLDLAARSGVRFLGLRHDMELIYAASDIYVLASHREGFPRSAMEASAMGLPVIATNIRGCRQVVEDQVTGLLVPVKRVDALVAAIGSLVLDPTSRRNMGAMAALKAQRDFDQQRVIDATLDAYADCLRVVGGDSMSPKRTRAEPAYGQLPSHQ